MAQENFKISSGQELKEEETKTVEYVEAMVSHLYKLKGLGEIGERIMGIAKELADKYPYLKQTYLFHIMAHSSVKREECANFDLPGEDSIVKRLEALVKEYEAK